MLVSYDKVTKAKGTTYFDTRNISQKILDECIDITTFPEQPAPKRGIAFVEFIDTETKTIYFKETPRPLTPEEKLDVALEDNEALKSSDLDNKELITSLFEMILGMGV
ncbi:hypothetical protein [Paenibacillus sp. sgz500958]|uniref:hypothetical protein n=1 Tax=Paenibacillus sp. sgz500958 TaxID=3242475 RepID=UPI0036D35D2B